MNERIKELAEQAGVGFLFDPDAVVLTFKMEKFVELIVQECIKVCEPDFLDESYEDMSEFGKGLVEGQDVAIEKIKQHFGVEE